MPVSEIGFKLVLENSSRMKGIGTTSTMALHPCLLLLPVLGLLLSPSSALSATATTRDHRISSTSTSSTRLRRAGERRTPGPHSTNIDDILANVAKEVNVTQSKPIEAIEAKLVEEVKKIKVKVDTSGFGACDKAAHECRRNCVNQKEQCADAKLCVLCKVDFRTGRQPLCIDEAECKDADTCWLPPKGCDPDNDTNKDMSLKDVDIGEAAPGTPLYTRLQGIKAAAKLHRDSQAALVTAQTDSVSLIRAMGNAEENMKKKEAAANKKERETQKKHEETRKAAAAKIEETKKTTLAVLRDGPRLFRASDNLPADGALVGGDGFVQLGRWRIGSADDRHFVIIHKDKPEFCPTLYRNDGRVFRNAGVPNKQSRLWDKPLQSGKVLKDGRQVLQNVIVEKGFMWFRGFRIGDVNGGHSSISHKNGWTAQIWRSDATVHPGPRRDYHPRTRNANCKTTRGYNYIDFGEGYHTWRIGEQSPDGYFTIAHLGTKRSVVLMAPDVIEGSVPQNGLRAWFKNENADANNWKSTVNGYVGKRIFGHVYVKEEAGAGARRNVKHVRGDRNAGYSFGEIIGSTFTACTLSRYTGHHRGAILQGRRRAWFQGHYGDRAGVAYYEGWITHHRDYVSRFNWVAMCGKNHGREMYINNGGNVAVREPHGRAAGTDVFINRGVWGGSRSDWGVSEVITWDRSLSTAEMKAVSRYLVQDVMGNVGSSIVIGKNMGAGIWEEGNSAYCLDAAAGSAQPCLSSSTYQHWNFLPLPPKDFTNTEDRYQFEVQSAIVGKGAPPQQCLTYSSGAIKFEPCVMAANAQHFEVVPYENRFDRYMLTQKQGNGATACVTYGLEGGGDCDAKWAADNCGNDAACEEKKKKETTPQTYGTQWIFPKGTKKTTKAEFQGRLDAKMVQATKDVQWEQYKANLHVKIASQRICATHYKQKTANSYLKCGDLCKLQSGCRVFSFGPMGGCRISACNDGAASIREGSCSSTEVRDVPQTNTNKCLESAVAQFGSRVKSRRGYLVKGHWGHVPSGCTVYTGGDWAAHFNSHTSFNGFGTFSPVTVVEGKAADGLYGGYGGGQQCGTSFQTGKYKDDMLYQIGD